MEELTKRQQELLNHIVAAINEDGVPPSISELAQSLKLKSKNAVAKLLHTLQEKGYIKRDSSARGIRVIDPAGRPLSPHLVSAPLLGQITAGLPIRAEENIEEWVNLPRTLIHGRTDVFLLRVNGHSMKNAGIFDQDMVIVRPTKDVHPDDIVAALIHDEATVKRLVRHNGRTYLKAENPAYADIHPAEEWGVLGKVVGVLRDLS